MNNSSPNVFVFDNHLDFLSAWLRNAKSKGFSKVALLKASGIKTRALLTDTLAGRKLLGVNQAKQLCRGMKLNDAESDYFVQLVELAHLKDPENKRKKIEGLQSERERQIPAASANSHLEYFALWHYPVIREYILSRGKVSSAQEIARDLVNLRLGIPKIRAILKKLIQWKLIRYDELEKCYCPESTPSTQTYENLPHAIVNDAKRDMIQASIVAMENQTREKRHITTAIRGISQEAYMEFTARIDALREEFLQREPKEGETVNQISVLNVQLFSAAEISNPLHEKDQHEQE